MKYAERVNATPAIPFRDHGDDFRDDPSFGRDEDDLDNDEGA